MTARIRIGVVGANRHARALAAHAAPIAAMHLVAWAPSPCGRDRDQAERLAAAAGAAFVPKWEALVDDRSISGLLVLTSDPARLTVVEGGLGSGKVVLCPVPCATSAAEAERLSAFAAQGGVLLSPGAWRHTPAGREALALLRAGRLGALHSVYAAVRLPLGDAGRPAVLEDAGWDLCDWLAAVAGGRPQRVHTFAGALFGGETDTVVGVLRFERDVVASVEVSRCLPAGAGAGEHGEVEVELIGSREALRLEPYRVAVSVLGTGVSRRPWLEAPVISMIADVVRAARAAPDRGALVAEMGGTLAVMEALRAAAASGSARASRL